MNANLITLVVAVMTVNATIIAALIAALVTVSKNKQDGNMTLATQIRDELLEEKKQLKAEIAEVKAENKQKDLEIKKLETQLNTALRAAELPEVAQRAVAHYEEETLKALSPPADTGKETPDP